MPKTKVRKSRTRKSGMRKSLRIKRGGTRYKPSDTKKAEKTEKSVNPQYDSSYQRAMRRSKISPPPTPPSDIEDKPSVPIAHKNTSVLSLPAHYFEGGPSYFRPTSKQVSELLNTK